MRSRWRARPAPAPEAGLAAGRGLRASGSELGNPARPPCIPLSGVTAEPPDAASQGPAAQGAPTGPGPELRGRPSSFPPARSLLTHARAHAGSRTPASPPRAEMSLTSSWPLTADPVLRPLCPVLASCPLNFAPQTGRGPAALRRARRPSVPHWLPQPAPRGTPASPPGNFSSSRSRCTSLSFQFPLLVHSERRLLSARLSRHPSLPRARPQPVLPQALAGSRLSGAQLRLASTLILPLGWSHTQVPALAHAIPSAWNSFPRLLSLAFATGPSAPFSR